MFRSFVLLGIFVLNGNAWSAGEPVDLGGVSLTGDAKLGAERRRRATKIWMEKVNARGRHQPQRRETSVSPLRFTTTRATPNRATKLVDKLISETGSSLYLGRTAAASPFRSAPSPNKTECADVCGRQRRRTVHAQFSLHIRRMAACERADPDDVAGNKGRRPSLKTVGIAVKDNLFSLTAARGAREEAKKLGYDVVFDEKYPAEVNDFSSVIGKAKESKADIVVELGHVKEAILFVKQSKELGFSPKAWTLQPGPETADFKNSLGSAANYVFWYALWSPAVPYKDAVFGDVDSYVKAYQAKFSAMPSFNSSAATTGAELIGLAIEKSGSTEPDQVRDALRVFQGETIMGPIKFDGRGVNVNARDNVVVYQVQDGKDVLVAPAKVAQGKVQLPMPDWSGRK